MFHGDAFQARALVASRSSRLRRLAHSASIAIARPIKCGYWRFLYRHHMRVIHPLGWHWFTRVRTIDGPAQKWCQWCGYRIVTERHPATDGWQIEAAAQWLMADDTAYAAEPDFARRAARHMLAAAQGIEAGTAEPLGLGPKGESLIANGDAPEKA
jgi:hypothetical protein